MNVYDKPCACSGLTSYRYKGRFGWIMIGARDDSDALKEARRSLSWDAAIMDNLQVWNGVSYINIGGQHAS